MYKPLIIARWEFFERIKKKSFIISMILLPLVLTGISILPSYLMKNNSENPLTIGVVDLTNKYNKYFMAELNSVSLPNGQPVYIPFDFTRNGLKRENILSIADDKVLSNLVIGYVIIEEKDKTHLTFRTNDIFNPDKLEIIKQAFNKSVLKVAKAEGIISMEASNFLSSKIVTLNKSFINANSEEDILKSFLNSYLFIILLITMILFSGGMFVRSLVLEKSNRIIEIILSSCTSKELLLGKVLGLSFFGLFQLGLWTIIGTILHSANIIDVTSFKNLPYQLLFFVIGYIFYSSIFIGFGSIINGDQEAQQLTGFLSIFLIFPIILAVEILRAPNSVMAIFLSYFPLTSVPVMLLRLNSTTPSLYEVVSVIMLLIFTFYLIILISSKLFRFGLLKTAKHPTIKEIISWLKLK